MCAKSEISETRLSNGLRVITEKMPESKSVSIGIWIDVGSRDEANQFWGCTHFMEHLLFKGTIKRSAKEISTIIEERGGYLNAFTDRDMTCYHAKVLGADLPLAVDVLSDMVQYPLLKTEDIDMERKVVLSEIDSRDDDPGDLIHDLYFENAWGENGAAHSILGEKNTLNVIDRDAVRCYFSEHYSPRDMVVTAAGRVEHEKLADDIERHIVAVKPVPKMKREKPVFKPKKVYVPRSSSQVQVALTTQGTAYGDENRDALQLISSYLGVGASSKLFQEVREKRGLVYSIFSTNYSLGDAGLFTILAGTQDQFVEKLLKVEVTELSTISKELTHSKLERIKHKTVGLSVLRSESSESRMIQLGVSTLRRGSPKTLTEAIDGVRGVAREAVIKCAEDRFLREDLSLTTLGLSNETKKRVEEFF